MQRLFFLAFTAACSLGAFAQSKTKDGYALSWDKEITTTTDTVLSGAVKVPATQVPVYEARSSDVIPMLKTVLPGAEFKGTKGVYTALGVSVPGISPSPVDILATVKDEKKQGRSLLSMGFLQNGAPVTTDATTQQGAMRDLAVKLNKAVVQQQLDKWEAQLTKATKNTESARSEQDKATKKASDASADLQKTTAKKSKVQTDIANNQADISRLELRWQTSQDAKDLKKLTKMRSTLAKNEKKLADLMADESKQQKTLNKRQDSVPDAAKDRLKTEDAQQETQRTVDALKRKLDAIH